MRALFEHLAQDWIAAHLVAVGVPLNPFSLYNAYRLLLIHDDTAVVADRDRQRYVRPDPELRDSLPVMDSYDFPHVTRDPDWLERLADRVRSAAAELQVNQERREAIGAERAAPELELHEGAAHIRKHVWPRLQLYRRPNRSNPGWPWRGRPASSTPRAGARDGGRCVWVSGLGVLRVCYRPSC